MYLTFFYCKLQRNQLYFKTNTLITVPLWANNALLFPIDFQWENQHQCIMGNYGTACGLPITLVQVSGIFTRSNNTETLCKSPIDVATKHSPQLLSRATNVSDRFLKAFTLFYNCHKLYDSASELSDIQVTSLGTRYSTVNTLQI